MPVANLRYNHLEQPWDSPISLGVQAFVEYNGLVLNDRYQTDRIRVTGITGLDGAEIRDSREPRPAAHNEYAYDAFYSGRNLTLTGVIEAGSLPVSNELKRNLLAAFAPLVESPLKFRWFDIYDNFDELQTIYPYNPLASIISGNYEALIGSNSNFTVENGCLSWLNIGNDYLIRAAERRVFGDLQSTIRIIPGSITTASTFGFIFGVKNSENYAKCYYSQNSGEPFIAVQVVVENVAYPMEQVAIPVSARPAVGIPFYLRGRKEGNNLISEFWVSAPSNYNLPTISVSSEMEGTDATTFGDTILAQTGFGGEQKDTLWKFDQYKVESLYPGDIAFNARCTTPPQIKDEQTSLTKFKRNYQITLRSSDFRAFATTQFRKSIVPNNAESSILGLSFPIKFPLGFRNYISSSIIQENNIVSVNNRGSVFIEPTIIIYGPFETLAIKNLTNELELFYGGSILENDYLMFICGKTKSVTNSLGQNKQEFFSSTNSAWLVLEPMWNDIYVTGKGFNENSRLVIYGNYGYIG